MFNRLKSFLAPPVYADEQKTRTARHLNNFLIVLITLLTLQWLVRLSTDPIVSENMIIIAGLAILSVALLFVLRRGHVQLSSYILVITSWLSMSLLSWLNDGVNDTAFLVYIVIILAASLLSGWRFGFLITGLSIAAGWGFVYGESTGLIVPYATPASSRMIDITVIFALSGFLLYLLMGGLQRALQEARESNRSLQSLSDKLEARVEERTRDLALAAEVGRRITRVHDLDQLLAESVQLIQERFKLYHVQIYLADAAGQNLFLRASTGTVGRQLLNRGHRLPIRLGSINGTAAFNKKPVLVPDTESNPIFRQNILLPYTRSEMAVPLLAGDQVLGVLDLQSDQPNALSEENLPVYDSLAGQLAVTIDNARLLRQTEQVQAELRQYVQLAVHEGWEDFLDGIKRKEKIGVRYDLNSLETYDGPVVAAEGNQLLQVPITVANTPIGTIHLEAEEGQDWTEETRAMVMVVAQQVGQQAENLRLLTETNQYRAEAEQAARRLSGQVWLDYLREQQDRGDRVNGFVYTEEMVEALTEDELPADSEDGRIQYPLKINNEAIAEFVVNGTDQDEAQALLATVSNQLSRHIENIRLAKQTESALGQTESLYQIGHELNTATNIDEILHAALGPIFPTGIDEATLMFIELDNQGQPQTLELLAGWRLDGTLSFPVGTVFPMERFPFTSLFINDPDDPQLIGDAATDSRVDDFTRGVMAHAGINAIAVIPLTMAGQWVGIITCSWSQPRTFSRQEEEIFNALINMAAPAVQSQRLHFKTKAQAEKEHLINYINERIQSTVTVESALQTAVTELGQALKLKEAMVELSNVKQDRFLEENGLVHFEENGKQSS